MCGRRRGTWTARGAVRASGRGGVTAPGTRDIVRMSGRAKVDIVDKPWGHEVIWAHTDRYVGKVLHIKAGHALSVQYHDRKDETISLLAGEMIFRVREGHDARTDGGREQGDLREIPLRAGDSYRITPGTVHQMEAVTDCQVMEASTPELDDVVRLTDRYGRV